MKPKLQRLWLLASVLLNIGVEAHGGMNGGSGCLTNDWDEFLRQNHGSPIARRDHVNRVYFTVELINSDPVQLQKDHPEWTYEQPLGTGPLANEFLFSAPISHTAEIETLDETGHFYRKHDGSSIEKRLDTKQLQERAQRLDMLKRSHGIQGVQLNNLRQMHKRLPKPPVDSALLVVEQAKQDLSIEDPIFDRQWHLINPLQPGNDLNIVGLWKKGIVGTNVSVAVVDDGLDFHHADLRDNYFPEGSYDFNDIGPDPLPRLDDDLHGTRCCGEIAAAKNDACGVGVAYKARIAGIRILSGPITEADEAMALNYGMNVNDVYSCSWGPPDDGRSMAEPGRVVRKALINGVQNGRQKKGNIFVFASGNGAMHHDNCNFDGYTNSIYSITISAIDRTGLHPYYAESCSANMAVTYSSNSRDKIHTTDVGEGQCSDDHGGTSAAAPLAAGVFALVLQVRPELTWRDMQYLTVDAAVPVNEHDPDWQKTAIGKQYSHKYGYGKIDSERIVERAQTIELVKPQTWFFSEVKTENQPIVPLDGASDQHTSHPADKIDGAVESTIEITSDNLENMQNVEHVNVMVNIGSQNRGSLTIDLISPSGVVSRLAAPRPYDRSREGFSHWTFMSVAHWGETGIGTWTLRVFNGQDPNASGQIYDWTLKLWGQAKDASKTELYSLDNDRTLPGTPVEEGEEEDPVSQTSEPSAPSVTHTDVPVRPVPSRHQSSTSEDVTPSPSPVEDTPSMSSSAAETPTATDNPDAGWSKLIPTFGLSKHTALWVWGSLLIILIFIIGVVTYIFLWKRRQLRLFKPIPTYDYDVEGPAAQHRSRTEDGDEDLGVDDDDSYHGEYDFELEDYDNGRDRLDNNQGSQSRPWAGKNARDLYSGEELFKVNSDDEEDEHDITEHEPRTEKTDED